MHRFFFFFSFYNLPHFSVPGCLWFYIQIILFLSLFFFFLSLQSISSLTFFFPPHVGCERHEVSEFPVWNYPYFLPTYLIYTLTHSWDSGVIPSTCALGSERHCPSCWTKHCSTDEELDISQILFIGSILSLRNLLLFYFCLSA